MTHQDCEPAGILYANFPNLRTGPTSMVPSVVLDYFSIRECRVQVAWELATPLFSAIYREIGPRTVKFSGSKPLKSTLISKYRSREIIKSTNPRESMIP